MPVAKDQWQDIPRPSTTAERIAYMQACQMHFSQIKRVPPMKSILQTTEASGVPAIELPSTLVGGGRYATFPDNSWFKCTRCGESANVHPGARVIANPYSDWCLMQCATCAS